MTARQEVVPFWALLPFAVLVWLVTLMLVGRLFSAPVAAPPHPDIVEARLVELSPPPPRHAAPPPVQAAPVSHAPTPAPAPAAVPPPVKVSAPPPAPPAPPTVETPPPSSPPPLPHAAAKAASSDTGSGGLENHGPVALATPEPELADDLLSEVAGQSVSVRLRIGADGSVQAHVENSGLSPRLRQALARQITQGWRFRPAVHNGTPVAAEQTVSFAF